jgi:hypothetical protein
MIAAAAPLRGLDAGILLTCTNDPMVTKYCCRISPARAADDATVRDGSAAGTHAA